jgi:hypothetical protein
MRQRFGAASRQIVEPWNNDRAAAGVLAAVAAAVGSERWHEASTTADIRLEPVAS